MSKSSGQFAFKKHDVIGAYDAEHDAKYLEQCFVDTGDLNVMRDCGNPKQIVLGRTGSGKSALILKLMESAEHAIQIQPESLSLNYIANSTIIKFFSDLGVNLDPFYKLLWRHVFAVEIFKHRFGIADSVAKQNFLARWLESREDKAQREKAQSQQKKALDYLDRFSETFWEDTEYRTKEITNKFENELKQGTTAKGGAKVGGKVYGVEAGASSEFDFSRATAEKLSTEEKAELIHRATEVVNSVQVKELNEIIDLVKEVLDDAQKRYYIVIDRLDDSWADEAIRYRLIKALIDTVREFGKVRNVKIIIGMRIDLIDRVFRESRDPGFQEEKYRSLYLPVSFNRAQLIDLVDRRIAQLIKDQYTGYKPTHKDILPSTLVGKKETGEPVDYLLNRTWGRPRDVIEFFNICIEHAEGKARFTKEIVVLAEGEYSRLRFRSLADEWKSEFPELAAFVTGLLSKGASSFALDSLPDQAVEEFCLKFATEKKHTDKQGILTELAESVVHTQISADEFRQRIAAIFYRIGAVGLKISATSGYQWADNGSYGVSPSEIATDCGVAVHPALWRVLGISPPA
jgi:hypothetical protein